MEVQHPENEGESRDEKKRKSSKSGDTSDVWTNGGPDVENGTLDGSDEKLFGRWPQGCIRSRENIAAFYRSNKKKFYIFVHFAIYLIILAYGAGATVYWHQYTGPNIDWCSGIGLLWLMFAALLINLLDSLIKWLNVYRWIGTHIVKPIKGFWIEVWKKRIIRPFVYLAPIAAILTIVLVDTKGDKRRLTSLLGVAVIMLFGFTFSKYRTKVNWRTVISGIVLQYIFALLSIRWIIGREVLQCVGDKVTLFLEYSYVGASMVYGDFLVNEKAVFAFQVLSTIFFFGFIIQILYFYGAMQWIIIKIGSSLQFIMGTTACESINTSSSVFIGMTEAPLLIKPYIRLLTKSEIHSVMAGGLSTIAGSVMAAYISFGVSPAHLITASIMSAPAALCFSKLFYPETEKSKTDAQNITMDRGTDANVLDAAASGAISAIELVAGIIANLIAFVSFIAFLNAIISWFGSLLGVGYISFEWILAKVFIPLAWLLGVAPEECEDVATLMGLKTIVNEFVAYQRLSVYIKAGKLSNRAITIATYALCGFSNPGSVGILIGSLSALAPEKRPLITEVAIRAFISGSATCFLTACVAGTLIDDSTFAET